MVKVQVRHSWQLSSHRMSHDDLANAALSEVTKFRDLLAAKGVFPEVAWDIGGNVGLYAIALACVFPEMRVHTFEPVQENLQSLRENVARNSLDARVTVHPVGVSDTNQDVSLGIPKHREADNTGLFSVHYNTPDIGKEIVHNCRLVDGACALEMAKERPDIVKIDVEGAEMQVLSALDDMASAVKAVIVEVAHDPRFRSPDEVNDKLNAMGFSPVYPGLDFIAAPGKRGRKAYNRLWVSGRS